MDKILVVGKGGRESALLRALSKYETYQIVSSDFNEIVKFVKDKNIDLTIVASEELLVKGIADRFKEENLKLFGPYKNIARLEGSKSFAKDFMKKYGIKTAKYEKADSLESAIKCLKEFNFPVVIKVDGLAAGKGVFIVNNLKESNNVLNDIFENKKFGNAGDSVVIEEYLEGVEVSILSFANEKNIIPLVSAKDHKKIGEGEKGLNTGGMGTFAPNPYFTKKYEEDFILNILNPTLEGIRSENFEFSGIIFFGLMLTNKGTYLLEYNMRFGDPETQVVLPLINEDIYELIKKCMNKNLKKEDISFKEGYQICLVLASGGYPEKYETGYLIKGLENVDYLEAGVKTVNDLKYSDGGRVLNLVAYGKNLKEAREIVYKNASKVSFKNMVYRKDIGNEKN